MVFFFFREKERFVFDLAMAGGVCRVFWFLKCLFGSL